MEQEHRIDPYLACAWLLSLLGCLHGVGWGVFESWNPDQMAMRSVFLPGLPPFHPGGFLKPPLTSYINFFLAQLPVRGVQSLLGLSHSSALSLWLIWSRLLVWLFFAMSIGSVFSIGKRLWGLRVARALALLFATSAGFVAFSHFLTADLPLMSLMMLSFFCCVRMVETGNLRWYLGAGALAGLAMAAKYNGLAIGIALFGAHLVTYERHAGWWWKFWWDRRFVLGVLCVPLFFVLGCPYALLDVERFLRDFFYNYTTTPIYSGLTKGHSFGDFWGSAPELFGYPLSLLMLVGVVWCGVKAIRREIGGMEGRVLMVAGLTFLVYYAKFGGFPRWETRFGMPIFPLALLVLGPLLASCSLRGMLVFCVPLFLYNVWCSAAVGGRFLDDPRMAAISWVRRAAPKGAVIESTLYCPSWRKLEGFRGKDYRLPFVSGRARLFRAMLKKQPTLLRQLKFREEDRTAWASLAALEKRKPDLIALNDLYLHRFFSAPLGELYPEMRSYFGALLAERGSYLIVFDKTSRLVSPWLYPQKIDFLHNRMVLLQRRP